MFQHNTVFVWAFVCLSHALKSVNCQIAHNWSFENRSSDFIISFNSRFVSILNFRLNENWRAKMRAKWNICIDSRRHFKCAICFCPMYIVYVLQYIAQTVSVCVVLFRFSTFAQYVLVYACCVVLTYLFRRVAMTLTLNAKLATLMHSM